MTITNTAVAILTLLAYWSIISIAKKRQKKSLSFVIGSQKDIHNLTKVFLSRTTTEQRVKVSQMTKYEDSNRIDVLVVGEIAYWISKNVFYKGEIVDGQIDHETTEPIDTSNMQKDELDKMLFILDSLKNGRNDDIGGTGH